MLVDFPVANTVRGKASLAKLVSVNACLCHKHVVKAPVTNTLDVETFIANTLVIEAAANTLAVMDPVTNKLLKLWF